MVRLMTNPLILRATLVLFVAGCAFAIGIWLIKRLREDLGAERELGSGGPNQLEALPLHLYNTVIQQLKQQKHELQVQTQEEQRRARTTESLSQAVLSNLPSGVLVFGTNGLVKQANPAARKILGFNSPAGMSAEDIFRNAAPAQKEPGSRDGSGAVRVNVSEEIHAVLREGSRLRQVEADYCTPSGQSRRIALTISQVPAVDGNLIGAACLVSDRTELEQIRRQQELQGEISAEMALELRTSLTTIAEYARQIARNGDPARAPQLAADIASETARLDRHIGGFLAAKGTASGR